MIKDIKSLLHPVANLSKQVGREILVLYQSYLNDNAFEIQEKADGSPVTEADLLANMMIIAGLNQLALGTPILSEESIELSFSQRKTWSQYWLVDPLDGTRDFISKSGDFSVNIALIENHQPVLGVIYSPVKEVCYFACRGQGAFKQLGDGPIEVIQTRKVAKDVVTIAASRHHGSAALRPILSRLGNHEIINMGSALKFGLVAEGVADIYIRLGPTSEWDTAAGHCIVTAAGGRVTEISGEVLPYNSRESVINPPFVAVGDAEYNWASYLA